LQGAQPHEVRMIPLAARQPFSDFMHMLLVTRIFGRQPQHCDLDQFGRADSAGRHKRAQLIKQPPGRINQPAYGFQFPGASTAIISLSRVDEHALQRSQLLSQRYNWIFHKGLPASQCDAGPALS